MRHLRNAVAEAVDAVLEQDYGKRYRYAIVGVESVEIRRYDVEIRVIDEDSDEEDTRNVRESINSEIGESIAKGLNTIVNEFVDEGLVEDGFVFTSNQFSDKGWYTFSL